MREVVMAINQPADLPYGGVCAWALPSDDRCAQAARTHLGHVMQTLRFDTEAVENAQLAVSELATNAHRHVSKPRSGHPDNVSELAVWARTWPVAELVVSVFDSAPQSLPHPDGGGPLAESGRGMTIVGAVTNGWGAHPSRPRLADPQLSGKAVWMAVSLPAAWPRLCAPIFPVVAAQRLAMNLAARGVRARRTSEATGISLVETPGLNVWVCRSTFAWTARGGVLHRHPHIDLQETTEHVIATLERSAQRPAH
ncbi:ATP-binding protein [Spirillospora sp. NPDC049652]